jgi:hypothetical protein
MFSTSSLYFLVAIFGESIENDQTQVSQLAKGQEEVVDKFVQNENQNRLNEVQSLDHQYVWHFSHSLTG